MASPKTQIDWGDQYPYDAPDEWWNGTKSPPPPAVDWAHRAARAVIADLKDRRGIKNGFEGVDQDVRIEIVNSLAEIIRFAAAQQGHEADVLPPGHWMRFL